MAIVLRLPKRPLRAAVAGLAVVALGAGVAAQTNSLVAPVRATQMLDGAVLPHDVSVAADFDRGPQTRAQHPEEELLAAPTPTPQVAPAEPGQAPQGEQSEGQQGEQNEGQQGEQGESQQAEPPSTDAASGQDLLTPEEREALALIEQMILDREGALMGTGTTYNSGGRRDPFMSLVPNDAVSAPTVRPFGLPGFLISEVDLKAVASAQGRWHAMVLGPNQRAYFVVVGTQLFDGHVVEIRPGEVVFEQVVPDLTGARRTRPVTKRLRTTDGGGETP